MSAGEKALGLIERFEGCQLRAYRDPVGLWTVGYGHLLSPDPEAPDPEIEITQAQADALLVNDLNAVARQVGPLLKVPVSENELAALLSFAFNVGVGNLRASTLRSRLNRGERAGAADEFPRWIYSRGARLPGLVRRRAAERALFLANP